MGRDKAMTPVPGTERTMLEAVIAALASVTDDLVIVAPPRPAYRRFGFPVVGDAEGPPGPLRGIAAGINAARSDRSFVLACDLPFVNHDLLRWMADLETDADALVPVTQGVSRQGGVEVYQTLHAIYAKTCLPSIRRSLECGDFRTTSFLARVQVQTIDEDALRRVDPALRSFANVNTPSDWYAEPHVDERGRQP